MRAAKPRQAPYKLADGGGLFLLMQPNGSRLWRLKYRVAGREKLLSFGAYPATTLAEARSKRENAKKLLASGVDPSAQRKSERLSAEAAAANTFGVMAAEYLAALEAKNATKNTISKNRWLLEDLAASLSERPLTAITPAEILAQRRCNAPTRGLQCL